MMRGLILVAVGTSNPMKVRAAERVFKLYMDAEVKAVNVDVSVGSQPVGFSMVARGALERAIKAREAADADYGVGVEAGPIEAPTPRGLIEVQVSAIIGPGCRVSFGLSPGFELESSVAERVKSGVELERAVKVSRLIELGEGVGLVGVLTSGFMTRQEMTEYSILMALIPWITGYDDLPSAEEASQVLGFKASCRSRKRVDVEPGR